MQDTCAAFVMVAYTYYIHLLAQSGNVVCHFSAGSHFMSVIEVTKYKYEVLHMYMCRTYTEVHTNLFFSVCSVLEGQLAPKTHMPL